MIWPRVKRQFEGILRQTNQYLLFSATIPLLQPNCLAFHIVEHLNVPKKIKPMKIKSKSLSMCNQIKDSNRIFFASKNIRNAVKNKSEFFMLVAVFLLNCI